MSLKELLFLWAQQTMNKVFFFLFFFNCLTSRNFFFLFHLTVLKQTNKWKFIHRNL